MEQKTIWLEGASVTVSFNHETKQMAKIGSRGTCDAIDFLTYRLELIYSDYEWVRQSYSADRFEDEILSQMENENYIVDVIC